MNGYEAARHIRRQTWGSKATLIAVTGWGQDGDRQKSKDAGFDHHLVKPVAAETLLKILESPRPTMAQT
jgi:CheY-like chemotaxis protein